MCVQNKSNQNLTIHWIGKHVHCKLQNKKNQLLIDWLLTGYNSVIYVGESRRL